MPLVRASLGQIGLFAAAVSGCQAAGASSPPDAQYFVAFAPDFYGFHDWPSAIAVPAPTLPTPQSGAGDGGLRDGGSGDGGLADAGADGGIHSGPLTVYWNRAPVAGSTSFPVGTIIVKEGDSGDLTTRQIFAMVKRGGDFNPTGAVGWEWFELKNIDEDSDAIVWRGVGPPAGERYGGDPATCNDCHAQAASNDCVWSSALQLAGF
jgi:hypothetical protein